GGKGDVAVHRRAGRAVAGDARGPEPEPARDRGKRGRSAEIYPGRAILQVGSIERAAQRHQAGPQRLGWRALERGGRISQRGGIAPLEPRPGQQSAALSRLSLIEPRLGGKEPDDRPPSLPAGRGAGGEE